MFLNKDWHSYQKHSEVRWPWCCLFIAYALLFTSDDCISASKFIRLEGTRVMLISSLAYKNIITAELYMHTNQHWAEYSLVKIRKEHFVCLLEMKTPTDDYLLLQYPKIRHTCPSVPSSETIVTEWASPEDSKDSVGGKVIILPSCVTIVIAFPIACWKQNFMYYD